MVNAQATHRSKSGLLEDRILKAPTYGKEQKSETQVKIGKIREALKECVRKQKEAKKYKRGNISTQKDRNYRRSKRFPGGL